MRMLHSSIAETAHCATAAFAYLWFTRAPTSLGARNARNTQAANARHTV